MKLAAARKFHLNSMGAAVVVLFLLYLSLPSLSASYWESAPEDPAFLRDTRDIPEIDSFINKGNTKAKPAPEREVIIETVKSGSEQELGGNLVLNLPNLSQILLVAGIVILFILYRTRQARAGSSRRR